MLHEAETTDINRRETPRKLVSIKATIRMHGTFKVMVSVEDLSETGFRCSCLHDMAIGTKVWLSLPSLSGFESRVIRRDCWMYGFLFDRPLHPAMFDHIVRQYAIANTSTMPVCSSPHPPS
jgi:hypothetical protein